MEIVSKLQFQFYKESHQSHHTVKAYIPGNAAKVRILFRYGPVEVTDQEEIRYSLEREGLFEAADEDLALRNLLTLSVYDPERFRGNRHAFVEAQEVEIGVNEASLGFIPGALPEGYWDFSIHCHGIFGESVSGALEIQVEEGDVPRETAAGGMNNAYPVEERINSRNDREYLSYRSEMHAHTTHSDAAQTVGELVAKAKAEGIRVLAVTDHNTVSAHAEAERHSEGELAILKGMEFTTYFGHFLVYGDEANMVYDWRDLSKNNLEGTLREMKSKGLSITIAHPFDMGNPFCTGCQWEYLLPNLRYVDAIEVWNGTDPSESLSNQDAYLKWCTLLSEGSRIPAIAGRDWHSDYPDEKVAYTYFLLGEDKSQWGVQEALECGRFFVSTGPLLDMRLEDRFLIGDAVSATSEQLAGFVRVSALSEPVQIALYDNKGCFFRSAFIEGDCEMPFLCRGDQGGFVRAEILNGSGERTAFSNPIYIDSMEGRWK